MTYDQLCLSAFAIILIDHCAMRAVSVIHVICLLNTDVVGFWWGYADRQLQASFHMRAELWSPWLIARAE